MVHETVQGGHDHPAGSLQQGLQHQEPLAGHHIPMDVRRVEEQVLGRIEPHIPGEIPEILIDLLCPGLVIGDDQLPGIVLPQLVHQMDLLGIQGPNGLHRAALLQKGLGQLFVFDQFC